MQKGHFADDEAAHLASMSVEPGQAEAQQGQGPVSLALQVHDTVLKSILGVGLDQLQICSAEAVVAVSSAVSRLQDQLQAATQLQPAPAHYFEAHNLQPQLILLKETLRAELRDHAACQVLDGSLAPEFIAQAEESVNEFVWPLILAAMRKDFD